MTLIYASKQAGGKSIILLSDTKISDPNRVSSNGYLEPQVKCVPVSQKFVVCFAGEIELGLKGVELVGKAETLKDAQCRLMGIHQPNKHRVDFILCDILQRSLFLLQNGECRRSKVCWIGNRNAYVAFKELLEQVETKHSESTRISIVMVGEKDGSDFGEDYSRYLDAFHELVMRNEHDVGGICVPYIITKRSRGFGHYLKAYRPPLSEVELNRGGAVDMMFRRPDTGAFTINFSGNEYSFTAEIPQSAYKLSFKADGMDVEESSPIMGIGLN